jgi:hypothetical protein
MSKSRRPSLRDQLRAGRTLVAAALAVLASLVAASTLLPGAPYFPADSEFSLFVAAFPLAAWSTIEQVTMRSRQRRMRVPFADYLEAYAPQRPSWMPKRAGRAGLVIETVLLPALLIGAASGLIFIKGQPEHHGSRYYADNQGHLTPLSRPGYEHQVALEQRIVAGLAADFLFVVVLAGLTPTMVVRVTPVPSLRQQ